MAIFREERRCTWVTAGGGSGRSSGGGGRARTAEGFDGGAQTAGSRSMRVNLKSGIGEGIWSVDGMRRERRVIEKRSGIRKREIGFSFRASEGYGGVIVSTGGVFGGIKGP